MVALIGASSCGKSTLHRHMAGLMTGDSGPQGSLVIHNRTVQRNRKIVSNIGSVRCGVGFAFQQFNLEGRWPVIINVLAGTLHKILMWRSLIRRFTFKERARGIEALRRVGIAGYSAQRASILSGAQ